MDAGIRIIVDDTQRRITTAPAEKANIERNVTHPVSLLDPT